MKAIIIIVENMEDIKKNKYFLMFDNLDEIYEELINLMNKNKPNIIEEQNKLLISIHISTTKIKEIIFEINEKEKSYKENIKELYSIINNLKYIMIILFKSKIKK